MLRPHAMEGNQGHDGNHSAALVEIAERLGTVVDRLRGVPIGDELASISRALREEIEALEDGTAAELAANAEQLVEERDDLRRDFAVHIAGAAQKEAEFMVRLERAVDPNDVEALRSEMAAALKHQAEALRNARSQLIAENVQLRAEVEAERQRVRGAKAELTAERALQSRGWRRERQGPRSEALPDWPHEPPALPEWPHELPPLYNVPKDVG
mmetsp:Transcript_33930/g.66748  ORF Transcript_33930/g.66748 Transcript_33930/m.66748 type:complete len:213 (+) Transcript_33930:61-699(+)